MGILSKIGSMGYGFLTSKSARKAAKGAAQNIKTTPQFAGSKLPSIAGGKSARSAAGNVIAKGITGSAKIAGKIIKPTAMIGVPIFAATKLYDYIGDVRAKTEDLRQYDIALKLAEEEGDLIDARRQAELDYNNKINQQRAGSGNTVDSTPSGLLGVGGGSDGVGGLFPLMGGLFGGDAADKAASEASTAKSWAAGAVALALIGSGIYIYSKKTKRSPNKKK